MEQLSRRGEKRLVMLTVHGWHDVSVLIVLMKIYFRKSPLMSCFKNWHVSGCNNCNSGVGVPNFIEIFHALSD